MGKREVTYYFSRNAEKKRSLERPGQKCEKNIKIHIKKIFFVCRQLGSICSSTVRRLNYFEHENIIVGST
jgi:hypothetical protein